MAYNKTQWKNRLVEKPKTFKKQDNSDGTLTLIPSEGNIIEAGTPINADNMNKIEEALYYHDSKIVDMVTKTGVETLTNKTLTTPKMTGGINDINNNELIKLEQTTSAVNEITIKNNVAGQAPQIKASGNDTNIDINLVPKGSGRLKENGNKVLLENDFKKMDADINFKLGKYSSVKIGSKDCTENIVSMENAVTETFSGYSSRYYSQFTTTFSPKISIVKVAFPIDERSFKQVNVDIITLQNESGSKLATFAYNTRTNMYEVNYNFVIGTRYSIVIRLNTTTNGICYTAEASNIVTYHTNYQEAISCMVFYEALDTKTNIYEMGGNLAIKKWGVLSFDKIIPTNSTATIDILDNNNGVLYSNVSSPFDLSNIDTSIEKNKQLKIKISATRTNINVAMPVIKNMVINFEGSKVLKIISRDLNGRVIMMRNSFFTDEQQEITINPGVDMLAASYIIPTRGCSFLNITYRINNIPSGTYMTDKLNGIKVSPSLNSSINEKTLVGINCSGLDSIKYEIWVKSDYEQRFRIYDFRVFGNEVEEI